MTEEENPLKRQFGGVNSALANSFNSLFDTNKLRQVQDDLLSKLKNELFMGITQPDQKNLMTMHIEKVPVFKQ